MLVDAMKPHGQALLDYDGGKTSVEIILERDDGLQVRLPVSVFFRTPNAFFPLEDKAIESCKGRVLDIGAGTGLHALALQERGHAVTALDISPEAVDVMKKCGVKDVRIGDIFRFPPDPFDTLLLLGHGIGMVENLAGLNRFLKRMKAFLRPDGQLLINSMDVTVTDDPQHLSYHQSNIQSCRYAGEIRLRILYKDLVGDWYSWLHVDADTLEKHAAEFGWRTDVITQEVDGNYLARLTVGS